MYAVREALPRFHRADALAVRAPRAHKPHAPLGDPIEDAMALTDTLLRDE
jgi:hypothetical protein